MDAIIDYLWAVFYTKWAGMFALLVGIDEFLEWTVPRYRARLNRRFSQRTRRITLLVAFLIFVFVAGFLAWDDERAERLDERAKHLASEGVSKRDLREAHEKIAQLESQPRIGEEAQAKIDSLIQANQQLQQEVEKLRAQTAEMRTDAAPRRIKDLKHFISVLSLFRGQRVDVEYVQGEREAQVFLNEIWIAIEVSGWIVEGTAAMGGQTWDGVIIEVDDLRVALPAAYELARLLVRQGTAAIVVKRSGPPKPGKFAIRVGYKPARSVSN